MENVKKAISLDPNNVDILYGYGFVLRADGQFDEAIQQFQKAISLDPIPPFYYFNNLGRAFFNTGRSKEATVAFRSALKRLPHPLVIARLGSCLVSEGKPQEALYEFDKALSKSAKAVTWVIGNRAIALVGIGRSEDAIETMQVLISQRPEDPDGYLYFSAQRGLT